ncbi:class I SAM-dependent methyltransferase [Yoonia sp. 208BN28-4]|uniref:class I SAM-dependent methyltransferase n=1 Tax=Yoonia sp. 208BN28-4 TaxID=3126505 RepID=UPI0030AEF7B0
MPDAEFWNRAAPKYAKSKIGDQAAYQETLERMRNLLKPTDTVLEIGCGTGSTALQLADRVAQYHATDVSSGMINIARGKLDGDHGNIRFDVAAAAEISGGPYDAILALNLLHLVDDIDAVMQAIHAALAPGGLFIAKTALLKDGNWFIPKIIPIMQFFGKAPTVTSLSDSEFKEAFTRNGFDLVETLTQKGPAPRIFTVARKV